MADGFGVTRTVELKLTNDLLQRTSVMGPCAAWLTCASGACLFDAVVPAALDDPSSADGRSGRRASGTASHLVVEGRRAVVPSDNGSLSLADIRSRGSGAWSRHLGAGGAAVAGGLLLLLAEASLSPRGRRRCRSATRARRPVAALLLMLLLLLTRRIRATTLSDELASSYSCYDPTGAHCSCTGDISLRSDSLTSTVPAELSACTGLSDLCATRHALSSLRARSVVGARGCEG